MSIPAQDHQGRQFPTMTAMARAYGMTPSALFKRLARMTLKEALTAPLSPKSYEGKACADHEGRSFRSITAMAAYWGVSVGTLRNRLHLGWSLQAALTTSRAPRISHQPRRNKLHGDPLGRWMLDLLSER